MLFRALTQAIKITTFSCCLLLFGCDNSSQLVLIKQVRLFNGSTIEEQVDVLISDGVIVSIGEHEADEAAIVVEGKGKTIIPLLVNAHAHVHEPKHLKESLGQGIGTVLDLFTSSEKAKQLRVFNDSIPYATYYTSGPGATAPGGHGTQLGYAVPTVSHASDANRFIRDRVDEGVDYIKIIREPLRSTLDFETIRALIEFSHQNNKLAIAHISTLADALAISELKINGFVHIWFDSAMDEKQLDQLVAQKPFVIPTLFATKKILQYANQQGLDLHHLPFEKIQAEVNRLHQNQILLLAGTDAPNLGINYHDALLEELRLLKACGLSDLEVLKTATINPAIAFSFLESQLIKENSNANFLLIEGDPTSDIESLSKVGGIWKNGIRIK